MKKEPIKNQQRRTLTKRLIKEALLDILKTKSIQMITVRELCDAAGVNRTTFYNHYNGVYEVLGEIEDNFLEQFRKEDNLPDSEYSLELHMEKLLHWLMQNSDIALLLLTNNVDPNFSIKLMQGKPNSTVWKRIVNQYPENERELLVEFISGGAYSLVCHWLQNGCKETPKQIASLLAQIIHNGIAL